MKKLARQTPAFAYPATARQARINANFFSIHFVWDFLA